MADKKKFLALVDFLRKQLKEVADFRDYFREQDAKYAEKQIALEQMIEWAEEEAVKEIKKDEV